MRFTTAVIAALPIFAAASAVPEAPVRRTQCPTSEQQCCQTTATLNDSGVEALAGLLGLDLAPFVGLVGLNCSPISDSVSCEAKPVCCTVTNLFNGLIVLDCIPLNMNT